MVFKCRELQLDKHSDSRYSKITIFDFGLLLEQHIYLSVSFLVTISEDVPKNVPESVLKIGCLVSVQLAQINWTDCNFILFLLTIKPQRAIDYLTST